ncbi:hypothetical protein ABFS83_06G184700 [Erythranthe nasuta]
MIIKTFLIFLFVHLMVLREFAAGCFITAKQRVYIISHLPRDSEPLKLHCVSRDDDLGFHTLHTDEEFHWSFCESFLIPRTIFTCQLWWGSKKKSFDAFKQPWFEPVVRDHSYWVARSDGIYFFDNGLPEGHIERYDWDN